MTMTTTHAALRALTLAGLALAASLASPPPAHADWAEDWTAVLEPHVYHGFVDYAAIAERKRPALDALAADLAAATPAADDLAFWIDAYNFLTLHEIVRHYPVRSPQEIRGFFDRTKHAVAGRSLTLNEIESDIIRAFGDPRTHFALICAAQGCPDLLDRAWASVDLESALDGITRLTLGQPKFVRVRGDRLTLSRIFAWYAAEFEATPGGLRGFLRRYRPDVPETGAIRYSEYDWTLNDVSLQATGLRPDPRGHEGLPGTTGTGGTGGTGGALPDQRARTSVAARDLAFDSPAALLRPGETEIKTFHNVYTQTAFFDADRKRVDLNARQTYYTGEIDLRRGLTRRLSGRLDLFWKSVSDGTRPAGDDTRTALTAIAPRLQFQPLRRHASVILEAGVEIPLRSNVDGRDGGPFLDFGDPVITGRLQHDRFHAPKLYGYYEIGGRLRLDHRDDEAQLTTPLKAILHYLPAPRITLTLPLEIAPDWVGDGAGTFYTQVGVGAKYRLRPNLELEAIGTLFPYGENSGAGVTGNLGVRYVL